MTEIIPITNPVALGVTTGTATPTTVTVVANAPEPLPIDFPADQVQVVKHPAPPPHPILEHFEFGHLPLHLQPISQEFHRLAHHMHDNLPMSAELVAGLRKLLEAKDCAVRAAKP